MGFDVSRFVNEVLSDYTCGICLDVMQSPKMIDSCEHMFCDNCITNSIQNGFTHCPFDREPISLKSLREPFRLFVTLIDGLEIRCAFSPCDAVVELKNLKNHEDKCDFNPENAIFCLQGCGAKLELATLATHQCLEFFKERVTTLETEREMLMLENANLLKEIDKLRVLLLKPNSSASSSSNVKAVNENTGFSYAAAAQSPPQQPSCSSSSSSINFVTRKNERFFNRLKSMFDLLSAHDDLLQLGYIPEWTSHPMFTTLSNMTNSERIKKILERTDLRECYGRNTLSSAKMNFLLALQMAVLEWVEFIAATANRILVIDYVEFGFSPMLSQIAKQVITATRPEWVSASNERFTNCKRLHYVESNPHFRKLISNIKAAPSCPKKFDLVISFSWYSFMDCMLILQDLCPNGYLLSYNKQLHRIEWGRLVNCGKEQGVRYVCENVLASKEQLNTLWSPSNNH